MSSTGGKLGAVELVPGAVTEVARVPSNVNYITLNIRVSYPVEEAQVPTTDDATVTIWIGDVASPTRVNVVTPADTVKPNGTNDYNCYICSPNEAIFVKSNANLVVRVEYAAEIAAE